jgi:hypothetical protein
VDLEKDPAAAAAQADMEALWELELDDAEEPPATFSAAWDE